MCPANEPIRRCGAEALGPRARAAAPQHKGHAMSAINESADFHADDETERSFQDDRLVALVTEYQRELEAGRKPSRQDFIARYPDLSAAVAECLDGVDMLRRVRDEPSEAKKPSANFAEPAMDRFSKPLGDFQIVRELA